MFSIYSYHNMVLDCEEESKKNGTEICQWEDRRQKNQLWTIEFVG